MARARSPCGASSLMTSAPRSPSTCVQYGPDRTCVMSRTSRPCRSGLKPGMNSHCFNLRLGEALQIAGGEIGVGRVDRVLEHRILRGDQAALLEPIEVAAQGGEIDAAPGIEPGRRGGGEDRTVLHA